MIFDPRKLKSSTIALISLLATCSLTSQLAWVQSYIVPLLSQHPHLALLGPPLLGILALIHNPTTMTIIGRVFEEQTDENADGTSTKKTVSAEISVPTEGINMKTPLILLASSVLCLSTLGCPSQNEIAGLVAIVGTAVSGVTALQGHTNLSSQIQNDTKAAELAVQGWKPGTASQDVQQALELVSSDLSLIPVSNSYAPYVSLAVGTVDSIIALLPPPAAGSGSPLQAHAAHRQVHLEHPPRTAAEFKKQWNLISQTTGAPPSITPLYLPK